MTDHPAEPLTVGPWRRRSRRTAYENAWIQVFHDEVDRPDGTPGIYGVVHFRTLAVGIVAVDDDGRLLLVGQHRYSLDEYSWEIPEGGVDAGESLEEGARRELREETGFDASRWRQLCRLTVSNSVTDERGAVFVAEGLTAGAAAPEATEDLATRWATLDEVLAEIAAGRIHDVITIAGVGAYALERLGLGGGQPADAREGVEDLPKGIGNPARNGLRAVGIVRLEQLAGRSAGEVQAIHGVGPKAIRILEAALAARGLAFGAPPEAGGATPARP